MKMVDIVPALKFLPILKISMGCKISTFKFLQLHFGIAKPLIGFRLPNSQSKMINLLPVSF